MLLFLTPLYNRVLMDWTYQSSTGLSKRGRRGPQHQRHQHLPTQHPNAQHEGVHSIGHHPGAPPGWACRGHHLFGLSLLALHLREETREKQRVSSRLCPWQWSSEIYQYAHPPFCCWSRGSGSRTPSPPRPHSQTSQSQTLLLGAQEDTRWADFQQVLTTSCDLTEVIGV